MKQKQYLSGPFVANNGKMQQSHIDQYCDTGL